MRTNGTTPTSDLSTRPTTPAPRLTVDLPPELLEQVAHRAAELLAERNGNGSEPWLNVEQAAEHLNISTSTLYTLCSQRHRNGIPLTKEGSRSYFKASELDRWRRGEHNGNAGPINDMRIERV
jgi:excisionase family DNA binding protein